MSHSEPPAAPEVGLRALHSSGSLGTTAALLRASIADDHDAIYRIVGGFDDADDAVSILLHLVRVAAVALRRAEGGVAGADRVVDTLAALDRRVER